MSELILIIVILLTIVTWFLEQRVTAKLYESESFRLFYASEGEKEFDEDIFKGFFAGPTWFKILKQAVAFSWFGWIFSTMLWFRDGNFETALSIVVVLALVFYLIETFWGRSYRQGKIQNALSDQSITEGFLLEAASEKEVGETFVSFFPVLMLVFVVRSFIFEPFTIPSESMLPTLEIGDYIVVNKFSYGLRLPVLGKRFFGNHNPERGDILVFKYPANRSINFIKRVVGVLGDIVSFHGGRLYVNGERIERDFLNRRVLDNGLEEKVYVESLGSRRHLINKQNKMLPLPPVWSHTVPVGHYFVMGDNRENSHDSRFWKYIPEENIVGEAVAIWMSMKPGWTTDSSKEGLTNLPSFERVGVIDKVDKNE